MFSLGTALILVFVVAVIAGAIASVAGFGIGSLLTPLIGLQFDIKLAVAIVSVPHAVATALRFWMLRKDVDLRVLRSFGLASAAGGLCGAWLGIYLASPILSFILGVLLLFAGMTGVLGLTERFRLTGWAAWTAGALSGMFGGLVGNQGGIRSAAMLGFQVPKQAFVATATAIGLLVDSARMPVYLVTEGANVADAWQYGVTATLGTVFGTLVGKRLLTIIPDSVFRRVVAAIILLLGTALIAGVLSKGR